MKILSKERSFARLLAVFGVLATLSSAEVNEEGGGKTSLRPFFQLAGKFPERIMDLPYFVSRLRG